MQIGTLAEWFAAGFSGLTAFLIWRQTRRVRPGIETERPARVGDRLQVNVTIRNHDSMAAIVLEEVAVEPSGEWKVASDAFAEVIIEPNTAKRLTYFLDGQGLVDISNSMPTMSFAIRSNRRLRRYKRKL